MKGQKSGSQKKSRLVYANVCRWPQGVLLAVCDAELLGKVLREGNLVFEVREDFYKGSKMSAGEAVDLMKQSTVVNMVGQRIVGEALERGLVHPEAVLEISGVPHAQIVKM